MQSFVEKPDLEWCQRAMSAGALWNTLVLAASVETLWSMGWSCFPEMMRLMEQYQEAIGTPKEDAVTDKIFEVMPDRNFSVDLLQRVSRRVGVIELKEVLWSDWGKPERILEALTQVGMSPNFPAHLAAAG